MVVLYASLNVLNLIRAATGKPEHGDKETLFFTSSTASDDVFVSEVAW